MKVVIVILLTFCAAAFGSVRIPLAFESAEVRQGALVKGVLRLDSAMVNVPISQLRGQSFAETIYFHELSPLLRKENSSAFESDIQVIFIKVPEGSSVSGKIGQQDVTFEWTSTSIIPVEAPGQMLWAEFTAPDLLTGNWMWIWIIPLALGFSLLGFRFWRSFQRKKRLKEKRRKLAAEFQSCTQYNDVVKLWQNKHTYLREFPQLEEPIRKFEQVLFRYQFKPTQTESEKETVVMAYQELLRDSEGGLRGI